MLLVEMKISTLGSSTKEAAARLRNIAGDRGALILTDYANPSLRQACEAVGLGYLDETGWILLRDDRSGLFVRNQGAARAPGPARSTAMIRLDGPGASSVIRALWSAQAPIGVRDLAAQARVSPGTAAKVLPALAQYGAISRDTKGTVIHIDRRLLIERWTQDYGIYTTNPEVHWLLAPRGPDYAHVQLGEVRAPLGPLNDGIALTGYLGALFNLPREPEKIYPVIPHTLMAIYSEDPTHLAEVLRLRKATPTTANVVLIKPRDRSLLQSLPLSVPLPQVLADLLTMGGRFSELAEQLFEMAPPAGSKT
ncbi:helix-turn-helix domain-containing protein [Kineococcus arenarius]|uniref:helix-turn-helix domain-containing protein n=1 Tax=Kineococcus sp. SYSU DK007 TaxID=3383128 RepID=UPI003D7C54F5